MDHPKENTVSFKDNAKYKVGAIIYDVTAHFCGDEETLESKIRTLLMNDIHRSSFPDKLAHSRNSDVII